MNENANATENDDMTDPDVETVVTGMQAEKERLRNTFPVENNWKQVSNTLQESLNNIQRIRTDDTIDMPFMVKVALCTAEKNVQGLMTAATVTTETRDNLLSDLDKVIAAVRGEWG